ncbi:MAG: c-type cytochrome [Prevotellaceae bacterium]|nr:c-type cytochrome [Prevotellaceae bacterium]
MKQRAQLILAVTCAACLAACEKDQPNDSNTKPDKEYSEEYYAGGKAGTVFITSSFAYKQPMPVIDEDPTLYKQFMRGERISDRSFVATEGMGYSGLGPVYVRKSCIACHPSYGGHSQRISGKFDSNDSRNGYLLTIYDPNSPTLAMNTTYFTGMPQTRAVLPFKPPIDENKGNGITITWLNHTDDYGNKFPDGETYELIYPQVTIDQEAVLFDASEVDMSKHKVGIEATIGIYGTGLLDAISDEDLRAEHQRQQERGYCQGLIGADIDDDATGGNKYYPGKHPGRFTYLCTRGSLDNGPGANAIWNITNVNRTDRTSLYITRKYAEKMSQDPDVRQLYSGLTSEQIADSLMSSKQKPEMTMDDYEAFMVWHRGLAVPAARNLDDPKVQRGKELFSSAGCAACHRPSWKTRDNYLPLPAISNQTIYPYTDLLRHDLEMHEPGRAQVCRTTPLWGRGLMKIVSGHSDRLHDLRARNTVEAIMWHGGEAQQSKEKFRNMPKEDRDALIQFLDAI